MTAYRGRLDVAGPALRFWVWQRWGLMRPAAAFLFDPAAALIRHHAFLSEGAGRHYATGTKVRSRWNRRWTARCRERLGMYPWSGATKSGKSPTLSRRTREGWGTRAHVALMAFSLPTLSQRTRKGGAPASIRWSAATIAGKSPTLSRRT